MNILWASPLNTHSAIAVYSCEVSRELVARGHSVTLLRTESGPEAARPIHATDLKVLTADDALPGADEVDFAVINYGNHTPYHARTLDIATRYPAIAVFHDAEMRDFEWGMGVRHGVTMPKVAVDRSVNAALAAEGDLVDPDNRPLLSALAASAFGAVVHSDHYRATVAAACPGPVATIPLCYPELGPSSVEYASDRSCNSSSACRRLTIFGVISPHKQPDRLLRAVAALGPECGAVEVHFAGSVDDDYKRQLLELAVAIGAPEPIFHGYVSDETLGRLLDRSAAICCLRHPVTEGGSASLITALYSGRPLIVSDVASYAMVPDELVQKVSYGTDATDLASALRRVFDDPLAAEAAADKARCWARTTYSASAYTDGFEALMAQAMERLPLIKALQRLAGHASDESGQPMPAALLAMAEAAESLFAER